MRTDSAVVMFSDVTIEAKGLKPFGVTAGLEPVVELRPTGYSSFLAVFSPVVVDVIYRQEGWITFAAAVTNSAVVVEDLFL